MSDFFKGVMQGIAEATDVVSGKANGSRTTRMTFRPNIDVSPGQIKSIRKKFDLSQADLAKLLDVGIDTVRKWEQGRNTPEGPSRRMLQAMQLRGQDFVDLFLKRA